MSARQSFVREPELEDDEPRRNRSRVGVLQASQSTPVKSALNSSAPGIPRTPRGSAVLRAQQLNAVTVTQSPLPAASKDVVKSNFEDWMKMAADNVCVFLTTFNIVIILNPLSKSTENQF